MRRFRRGEGTYAELNANAEEFDFPALRVQFRLRSIEALRRLLSMRGLSVYSDCLTFEERGEFFGKLLCFRNKAFPKDENSPATVSEQFEVSAVTSHCTLELLGPERHVFLWHGAFSAPSMSVPKTSMNQDDLPSAWENKIGLTRQVGSMQSVPVAEASKDTTDDHFGRGVARTDTLHSAGGLLVSGVDPDGRHGCILLRPAQPIHWAVRIDGRGVLIRSASGERLGELT